MNNDLDTMYILKSNNQILGTAWGNEWVLTRRKCI